MEKKTKVVSKPMAYWIISKTIAATLWLSIKTITQVYLGFFTREKGEQGLRRWSERLLHYAKVEFSVFQSIPFSFKPNHPYIIMSNHCSNYDIPLILLSFKGRSIRMLTKKELFKIPIWGKGLRLGEFIAIDRNDKEQALKDLVFAKQKMESGVVVWVAPEGTRSRTGKLLPFKKGGFRLALDTGATIIPVGIRGSANIQPPKSLTKISLNQKVEIHIGEPLDTTHFKRTQSAPLIKVVEEKIRILSGQNAV